MVEILAVKYMAESAMLGDESSVTFEHVAKNGNEHTAPAMPSASSNATMYLSS